MTPPAIVKPGGNPGFAIARLRARLAEVERERAAIVGALRDLGGASALPAKGAPRRTAVAPGPAPWDEFRGREWEAHAKYPALAAAYQVWQGMSPFLEGTVEYQRARAEYLRLLYGTTVERRCTEAVRRYMGSAVDDSRKGAPPPVVEQLDFAL